MLKSKRSFLFILPFLVLNVLFKEVQSGNYKNKFSVKPRSGVTPNIQTKKGFLTGVGAEGREHLSLKDSDTITKAYRTFISNSNIILDTLINEYNKVAGPSYGQALINEAATKIKKEYEDLTKVADNLEISNKEISNILGQNSRVLLSIAMLDKRIRIEDPQKFGANVENFKKIMQPIVELLETNLQEVYIHNPTSKDYVENTLKALAQSSMSTAPEQKKDTPPVDYPNIEESTATVPNEQKLLEKSKKAFEEALKSMETAVGNKKFDQMPQLVLNAQTVLTNASPKLAGEILSAPKPFSKLSVLDRLKDVLKKYRSAPTIESPRTEYVTQNLGGFIAIGKSVEVNNEIDTRIKNINVYLSAIEDPTVSLEEKSLNFGFFFDSYESLVPLVISLSDENKNKISPVLSGVHRRLENNKDIFKQIGSTKDMKDLLVLKQKLIDQVPVVIPNEPEGPMKMPSAPETSEKEVRKIREENERKVKLGRIVKYKGTEILIPENKEFASIFIDAKSLASIQNAIIVPINSKYLSLSPEGTALLSRLNDQNIELNKNKKAIEIPFGVLGFNFSTLLYPQLPEEMDENIESYKNYELLYNNLAESLTIAYSRGIKNIALDCNYYKKINNIRIIIATVARFIDENPNVIKEFYFVTRDAVVANRYRTLWIQEEKASEVTPWFDTIKNQLNLKLTEISEREVADLDGNPVLDQSKPVEETKKTVPAETKSAEDATTKPAEPKKEESTIPASTKPADKSIYAWFKRAIWGKTPEEIEELKSRVEGSKPAPAPTTPETAPAPEPTTKTTPEPEAEAVPAVDTSLAGRLQTLTGRLQTLKTNLG